jgi:predicted metal-dependent hydrolase
LKNFGTINTFTTPDNWPPEILPPANRAVLRIEAAALGIPSHDLQIRIREYRGTVIRASRNHHGLRISLHTALAAAPEDMFRAALRCILRRLSRKAPFPGDQSQLAAFCRDLASAPDRPDERPAPVIQACGQFFDLAEVFRRVNKMYFQDRLQARSIGWTKGPARSRLAYCRPETGEIRVSRLLDRPDVPEWFIEYLVYHEALHLMIPPLRGPRRTTWHHKQFREMEQAFPHYDAAQRFKDRLPRLLSRRPRRR